MQNLREAPTATIFISHSHHDNQFCRKFVASLSEANFRVWYDEDAVAEGLIVARVNEAFLNHDTFMPVMTSASLASKWVELEISAAIERYTQGKMRIIPILVDSVALSPILYTFKVMNFVTQPFAQAMNELFRALSSTYQYHDNRDQSETTGIGLRLQSQDVMERLQAIRQIESLHGPVEPGVLIDMERIMFGDPEKSVRRMAAAAFRKRRALT